MPNRYELRAIFEVEDAKRLLKYARRRHRACYPPGTEDAPPKPREPVGAIVDALINCKEGLAPEEFGLAYRQSVSGPLDEREETAVEGVRVLYAPTGGQGAY